MSAFVTPTLFPQTTIVLPHSKSSSRKRPRPTTTISHQSPTSRPLPFLSTPIISQSPSQPTTTPAGKPWPCIKKCGACCYLSSPQKVTTQVLDPSQIETFLEMIDPKNGWCKHYDHKKRVCGIYEKRPVFCRVSQEGFEELYGVEVEEFEEFAKECCVDSIEIAYGEGSREMNRYVGEVL